LSKALLKSLVESLDIFHVLGMSPPSIRHVDLIDHNYDDDDGCEEREANS
jgi:hypothetical protein